MIMLQTIQKMPKFFIDTADVDYIKRTWDKLLKNGVQPSSFLGVTTNPNALAKVECDNLEKLELLAYKLTKLTTDIRGDRSGVVYFQLPNSKATGTELFTWVHLLKRLGDGRTHIGMKIPPYKHILDQVTQLRLNETTQINVTGVSDAATALRCFSYPSVTYVSIIPGRMEEVGINADQHLRLVNQRYGAFDRNQFIIAGSMRTFDGLRRSVEAGTVPTIGAWVFDSMTEQEYVEFNALWKPMVIEGDYANDLVTVDTKNHNLTISFFEQMDGLGEKLYTEFRSKVGLDTSSVADRQTQTP